MTQSILFNTYWNAKMFEAKPNSTIDKKGDKTIFILCTGSDNRILTACVPVARDGTRLPLFLISKGEPHGRMEINLESNLPFNVLGCCHSKGWMDDSCMKLWIQKVLAPYVANYGQSVLFLDDTSFHKSLAIREIIKIMELMLIWFQDSIHVCRNYVTYA